MANNLNNTSSSSPFNLRSIHDKEKLNGRNFLDWQRNLRIVLMQEKEEYIIDTPIPDLPEGGGTVTERSAQRRHIDASTVVKCLMLATMSADSQQQFQNSDAYTINMELKNLFQEQAKLRGLQQQRQYLTVRSSLKNL